MPLVAREEAEGGNPSRAVTPARPALRKLARLTLRQIEFGDCILLLYFVAFARQYFWPVSGEATAWALTVAAATLIWSLHLASKEPAAERTPWPFWIVVALPLFVVYGMRAGIPDTSFDVLNYRLVNSERALGGWPSIPGDFFPSFYPLNPAPDMLLGITRRLLGYRLGTITNFLVLLWAGTLIERLLRPYVANRWLRSAGVLLVLCVEHALFLINNYMVDLLALPLLLTATEAALRADRPERPRADLVRIGVCLGAATALKLLNLAYAMPILLIYVYLRFVAGRARLPRLADALLTSVAFAAPLLPFTAYIYRETGSPVFPFYNAIFKSPYWPISNLYDGRWGPQTFAEALAWPFRVTLKAERYGEIAVYSGRVTLVFVAALICLALSRRDPRLRALGLATLLGTFLWAVALTGYARYASFPELLGGVMLLCLASTWLAPADAGRRPSPPARRAIAALLLTALLVQSGLAISYVARYEWSMRPTVFSDYATYVEESRFLLRDYKLEKFLRPEESERMTNAGVWIESGTLTSGFEALLDHKAPILCAYVHDYFYGAEGRERFRRALEEAGGSDALSLCVESNEQGCRVTLARRGLEIVDSIPVKIPVYSRRTKLNMLLLTVRPMSVGRVYSR